MPARHRVLTVLFFLAVFLALFSVAMGVALNHDEHQFVAAGKLLADQSLLPYRDFPYFHTPVLVLVYAALFEQTDYLFFAARLFSTVCAWLSLLALFGAAWTAFRTQESSRRLLLALGVALLFFTNPAFVYTFGKAWNNALPTLLLLLAFFVQCWGAEKLRKRAFFLSGVLVVLAAGTRISFAPLALPFLLGAWFAPGARGAQRWALAGSLIAGMTVGFLPTAVMAGMAPGEFLYDNFVYNGRVNALYRQGSGDVRSPIWAKLYFVLKTLVNPGNLVLFAGFLYLAVWPFFRRPWATISYPLKFAVGLFPFVLIGTFAPTPSYTQYYYPVAALCVVGVLYGVKLLQDVPRDFRRGLGMAVVVLIVSACSTVYEYRYVLGLANWRDWTPIKIHQDGEALAAHVPKGRVLTLAPLVPLEGGREIYPSLATGAFAWRTAPYLTAEERQRHGFLAPADLDAALALHPPEAILLGYQKKLEDELSAYAKAKSYRKIKLPDKKTLWVKP